MMSLAHSIFDASAWVQCVTWVACGSFLFVQDLSAGLRIGQVAILALWGGIEAAEWRLFSKNEWPYDGSTWTGARMTGLDN
jgi:hypothetical protein